MNKQLGTNWFTYYAKIRPWFACINALSIVGDFMQYQEVYTSYWWTMVYFLAALVHPVLCMIVFVKSRDDYEDFVRFVKGVLIFETINMAYGQAVLQYIQNGFDIGIALVVGIVILLLGYLIWYRLNMKYFKKRIKVTASDHSPEDPNRITVCKSCGYRDRSSFHACPECGQYVKQYFYLNQEPLADTDKIRFCRKCGEKLIDNSRFCRKCGTEIVN